MKHSYLEARFAAQWTVRYPELPFEREHVILGWRDWAAEKKAMGFTTRAVPMRADFAWPAARVALEIQGGQWVKSGHSSGSGLDRDAVKALIAQLDGWALVALTERMLTRQAVIWLPRLEQLIRTRQSGVDTDEP